MEWCHELATLIPTEHVNPGLSQIGVVVYDGGLFGDALIAQCGADLVASDYRLGGVVQSNALRPDIEVITAWCRNAVERGGLPTIPAARRRQNSRVYRPLVHFLWPRLNTHSATPLIKPNKNRGKRNFVDAPNM
jgi:hypothetical protein